MDRRGNLGGGTSFAKTALFGVSGLRVRTTSGPSIVVEYLHFSGNMAQGAVHLLNFKARRGWLSQRDGVCILAWSRST